MYTTPIGLDFGTNNTIISAILEGTTVPTMIKTETGDTLHGSFVFYPEVSTEAPIFGTEALSMLPHQNVIRLAKRGLGVFPNQIEKPSVFNAALAKPKKNRHLEFSLNVDGGIVVKSAKEVVTDFLRHYRQLVINRVGENTAWVVSKPQNWNAAQNQAFHKALEAAGIIALKVITEPSAATFAYRAKAGPGATGNRTLVVDMGAGTFDVVLLHDAGNGNFRSVVVGGDDMLGASNVDEIFMEALHADVKKEPGYSEDSFIAQTSEIREKMKQLKHLLSTLTQASSTFHGLTTKPFTFVITRKRKIELLAPYYAKAEKALKGAFSRAAESSTKKHTPEAIMKSVDVVALVGGGMRDIHFGTTILPTMFPNAHIVGKPHQSESINPDEAVSVGNAFWAAALSKTPTVQGLPPDPIHVQVLARSLGVETVTNFGEAGMKRWFSQILTANTPIPTVKVQNGFTIVKDNQSKVNIEIYQGDGDFTTDENVICIGSYDVPVVTPNKANGPDRPDIEIEFEITEDSILIVRAGEKQGPKKELEIKDF